VNELPTRTSQIDDFQTIVIGSTEIDSLCSEHKPLGIAMRLLFATESGRLMTTTLSKTAIRTLRTVERICHFLDLESFTNHSVQGFEANNVTTTNGRIPSMPAIIHQNLDVVLGSTNGWRLGRFSATMVLSRKFDPRISGAGKCQLVDRDGVPKYHVGASRIDKRTRNASIPIVEMDPH
jgi:hypothetical protein